MFSLHCISMLDVCCHQTGKIGDFDVVCEIDQAKFVDDLIQIHTKTLNLVRITSSIYNFSNLGHLLCSMSLVVVLLFQMQTSVDIITILLLGILFIQLFSCCFIGQCVSTMVSWSLRLWSQFLPKFFICFQCEKLQTSLYCSKWYEITNIATKKKFLFMLMMMQEEKGFSAGGFTYMNMETFAYVIKTAYSFLTFLKNVM